MILNMNNNMILTLSVIFSNYKLPTSKSGDDFACALE